MGSILLQNSMTGEVMRLGTPFDQGEWCETLQSLEIPYDQEEWANGHPRNLEIAQINTTTPFEWQMDACKDPLLINVIENEYCDAYQSAVDAMYEWNDGNYDALECANICLQSDEITYYSYEEGQDYEGYGREILRWRFEDGQIPNELADYIDYDAYGRDYQSDYDYICRDGYLSDCGGIDTTYYSRDELVKQSLSWDWDYEPAAKPKVPQITADELFSML